jgi:hypothetical protein
MPTVRLAFAALAAATALSAHAGVVIEGSRDGDVQSVVMDGKKLRMESRGKGAEDRAVMIYDGDAQKIVQLKAASRTYSEWTQADMDRMGAQLKQSLAQLPPEHRAQAEAALNRGARGKARWEKTPKTESSAGQRCDVYQVRKGDEDLEEVCVAPFGSFGVSKADVAALGAFETFLQQATMAAGGGGFEGSWGDVPGIPLVTWKLEGGERRETFRASKVAKTAVPASQFTAPAGWTKERSPAQ